MRIHKRLMLAVAAALLAACGADVGEAGARLVVDEDLMTSEVLYVLPDVSTVPFTARELDGLGIDEAEAIPVRVEIFEDIAVAWFAPDGEARIGRDWIVALWSVERGRVERASSEAPNATPIVGEVEAGEAPTVNPSLSADVEAPAAAGTYDIELRPELQTAAEATIIEFWDRLGTPDELQMLEELYAHHPGC